MLSDTMLIINALITLFIGAALVLVVRQLGALQKSLRATTLVSAQSQARTFDQFLVQNDQLRSIMRYSRWDAASHLALHEMESRYLLWKAGISDAATWQADQAAIKKYADSDFVRTVLQHAAQEFRPDFIAFLAGKSSK
jgi:hypothetical protein